MCQCAAAKNKISKSKRSPSFVSFIQLGKTLGTHPFALILPIPPQPPTASKPFTMPPKPSVAPSRVQTRSKNKDTHPGNADRAPPRRTSVEVENDRARKAQAEAARQEEKLRKIRHTAEFEHADIAHEDVVDATPRPCFTPKPTRNSNKASLRPVAEVSDDCSDESNSLSYQPLCSEKSDNEEESAVEGDLQPPTKRLKAQTTGRAKPKVGTRAKKSRKAAPRAEEMEPASNDAASDEETPVKPKKPKPKMRDMVDIEMEKIEDRKKGGDMARPTSSQQPQSGTASPQTPVTSQVQVGGQLWGRALRRTGAIADIEAHTTGRNRSQPPDQSSTEQADPIRQVLSLLSTLMSLLTLDESTLLYWTLSGQYIGGKRKREDEITEWSSAVPNRTNKGTSRAGLRAAVTSHARPSSARSAAPSRRSGAGRSSTPSLISGTGRSSTPSLISGAGRSSAPSVLTDKVKIISRTSESAKVKPEPAPVVCLRDDGGLSDNDEMAGEEREAAFASPFKGKKRVTSEVCKHSYLIQ